ncbi:MAG: hypothetical protein JWQ87_5304 [Candidatus Sulfotelmatobacter sp.]|nr:hypothetical protein [Candidatus Sulfotelmatobacter sp.]
MKRIRQIVVALVGLFYVCLLYPLCTELWHSKWLLEMHDNECEPMFITFLAALGVFLLLAVRKPVEYRLVIAFPGVARHRTFYDHVYPVSRIFRCTGFHAATTM